MKPTLLFLFLLLMGGNLPATDFYWIGGTGAWGDVNHWATTSGGDVLHFTIPSANDNVFFDDNSFPATGATVDFTGLTARCRSLTVRPNNYPRFTNSAIGQLEIYGDFFIRGNVDWRFNGSMEFFGAAGNTVIDTEGRQLPSILSFVGNEHSAFFIKSDLLSSNAISFISGQVNFDRGTVLACRRVFVERNARVDFWGLTKIVSTNIDMYVAPDLQYSLGECDLEFTGVSNSLKVDGTSTVNFGSIRAPSGDLAIGNIHSSDTRTIAADSLLIGGNGVFWRDVSTNYLALTKGKTYDFSRSVRISVGGLGAEGTCSEPITLIGSEGVFLGANAGAVLVLRHLYVENIAVVERQGFIAEESYGLGNVAGWTFTNANGPTRYWVGGTGSWADTEHWAYVSGGSPGACPPTAGNDAIFDALSFTSANDTVYLPPAEWRVGTIDWRETNQPVTFYDMGGRGLRIYGSCYLNEALTWTGAVAGATLDFRSFTPGQQVLTYGRTQNLDLGFGSETGGWELLDSLSLWGSISLLGGHLTTNGHSISGSSIASQGKSFFDLENSNLYLRNGSGGRNRVSLTPLVGSNSGFNANGVNIISSDSSRELSVVLRNSSLSIAALRSIRSEGGLRLRATNLDVGLVRAGGSGEFILNGQIDSLFLTAGSNNSFETDAIEGGLDLGYLAAVGTCVELIALLASDGPYAFSSSSNQEVAFTELTGIQVSGPEWVAYSSVDQGGNDGWVFLDAPAPRQLYWVGGGGNWFDPAHWSESIGGPGGVCPPTQIDDVHFVDASFLTPGDTVNVNFNRAGGNTNDPQPACRSINANTLTQSARMEGQSLFVHGSVYLSDALRAAVNDLNLVAISGSNELLLPQLENTTLRLTGGGTYTLLDSPGGIAFLSIDHGRLNTSNYDLHALDISINSSARHNFDFAILDIGRSNVYVDYDGGGLRMGHAAFVRLLTTGGTIFLPASGRALINPYSPGLNLVFRNGEGRASLSATRDNSQDPEAKFGSVTFGGRAVLSGKMGFDTLRLAKGSEYSIDYDDRPLTIYHEFEAVGSVCRPLNISPGVITGQGRINFAEGATVKMDYVRLDRVDAGGVEAVAAGRNSLNINDSSNGWTFETNDGVNSLNRFFLGEDLEICTGLPPLLEPALPEDFDAEFTWQDGSRSVNFQPPGAGTYTLQISFDEGRCAIIDSLTISAPAFALNLPSNYAVCGADSLRISLPDSEAAGYSWAVPEGEILGQNDTSALVTVPGRYYLRQQLLSCADSTEIIVTRGDDLTTTVAVEVCENSLYTTPLATYSIREDTTITERYVAENGCDSLLTTLVTIHPTIVVDTLVELTSPGAIVTPLAEYFVSRDTTITEIYTTEAGCEGLRIYRIQIVPNTTPVSVKHYLPTAFSPNGDRSNDYLTVYGRPDAFVVNRMEVFDRWGGMIFHTGSFAPGDAAAGWDGAGYPTGMYVVVLQLSWPGGREETVRKIVHLMR